MRMNTDLTFDRFLRNEYGSDCALGLSVEYSQNFVVPIYIWQYLLDNVFVSVHTPSFSFHAHGPSFP